MVDREQITLPGAIGTCTALKAVRQKNGEWFVEFQLDFVINIDDTREVAVHRKVSLRAEAQKGRKAT